MPSVDKAFIDYSKYKGQGRPKKEDYMAAKVVEASESRKGLLGLRDKLKAHIASTASAEGKEYAEFAERGYKNWDKNTDEPEV